MYNGRNAFKKFNTLIDCHIQHIANRFALKTDFKRFAVIAPAIAFVAMDIYIGEEIHFDHFHSGTFTLFATPPFYIKRESTRFVTPYFCFGQKCKKIPDIGENTCISDRVRAGRTSNRRLIDLHHLVNMLNTLNRSVSKRIEKGFIKVLTKNRLQGFIDQCRFAAARNTSYANKLSKRKFNINILKIVPGSTFDDKCFAIPFSSGFWNFYFFLPCKVLRC